MSFPSKTTSIPATSSAIERGHARASALVTAAVPTDDIEYTLLRAVALQNAESIRIARQRAERQAEAALREQADLLNLTHDSIFVGELNGAIRYWNRASEELYGWSAEEALGKVPHDLLKTVFPLPLERIDAEVLRTGRWEGELAHMRKDGTSVLVASRWSLQRDEHGAPIGNGSLLARRRRHRRSARQRPPPWSRP